MKVDSKMAKKLAKSLKEAIAIQEEEDALRQQTEMFWLLQLQFMSMNRTSESSFNTLWGLYFSPLYKPNKHTRKIKKIMFDSVRRQWTEDEFNCLCTHFALQLAGVEE
jgi:hypothetical protein